MDQLTREHVKVIEQQERDMLREHAKKLAAALADAAGYLASVRADRLVRAEGEVWAAQTREWAEGAKQFAERANALLDEHDNLNP